MLIPHLSFYCSHFEWPEIADVSWPPWKLIRFCSSSVDFPHFGAAFRLSETGQICDFCAFSWEHKGGMASNLACWCILIAFRTIRFWSWSVDIPHFGVSRIFFRTHERNCLKFDMLMYPDHLWNWLHLGHGLLLFLILVPFWLSNHLACNYLSMLGLKLFYVSTGGHRDLGWAQSVLTTRGKLEWDKW